MRVCQMNFLMRPHLTISNTQSAVANRFRPMDRFYIEHYRGEDFDLL